MEYYFITIPSFFSFASARHPCVNFASLGTRLKLSGNATRAMVAFLRIR